MVNIKTKPLVRATALSYTKVYCVMVRIIYTNLNDYKFRSENVYDCDDDYDADEDNDHDEDDV